MKTIPLFALLAASLVTSAPLVHVQNATEAASTAAANPLSDADKAFVQAAWSSSSTEMDASKLAMTRSSDKDVKAFARHMMMGQIDSAIEDGGAQGCNGPEGRLNHLGTSFPQTAEGQGV